MSDDKTLAVCFTDIRGSTALNQKFGNVKMNSLKDEHFRVEKELIGRNSGTWVKSTGDGSLSYFDNPADAVSYLSEFLWIEAKHPGLGLWTFDVKAGFAHGEVRLNDSPRDVSGNVANAAAFVLGKADTGEILLDKGAFQALDSLWGHEDTARFCTYKGKEQAKTPEQVDLWVFDWRQYLQSKGSMTELVQNKLDEAHCVSFNTVAVPLLQPGTIFWPVVPRTDLNAIHKGQLEVIKLLSFCDWEAHLFIADSDSVFDTGTTVQSGFEQHVRAHAEKIGVSLATVSYLSRLFDTQSPIFSQLLARFKDLTRAFTVRDIFQYEGKSYEDSEAMVNQRSILEFLRTIFTLVAFEHYFDSALKPVVVISGVDERPKWKYYLETKQLCERASVICNPELKKGSHLVQQNLNQPIWRSKYDFLRDAGEMNLTQWAFDLFVCLPEFPRTKVTICAQYCDKDECGENPESCDSVASLAAKVAETVKYRLGLV